MILERSNLVSTNPIPLPNCPLTSRRTFKISKCCHSCQNTSNFNIQCYCNKSDIYSSTCTCPTPWRSGPFLTSHQIHTQASRTFYKQNTFALNISYVDALMQGLPTLPSALSKRARNLQISLSLGIFCPRIYRHRTHNYPEETAKEKERTKAAFTSLFENLKERMEAGQLSIKVRIVWVRQGDQPGEAFEETKACIRDSGFGQFCDIEVVEAWDA